MTEQQTNVLTELVANMRLTAEAVGPIHTWWDDIIEAEELLGLGIGANAEKAEELIAKCQHKYVLPNDQGVTRALTTNQL